MDHIKEEKDKYYILLVLYALALASSIILSVLDHSIICGNEGGCDIVQHSKYSTLLGINSSVYGIILFSLIILIIIAHLIKPKKELKFLIILGATIAAIIALVFIILQALVIHEYCKYCLIADLSSIAAFILIFFLRK